VLREERLVKTRRDGKYVYYSIGDPRVGSMLLALHGLFCSQKNLAKG
jgi:DNA-binding transcriptional ArsR family regulator